MILESKFNFGSRIQIKGLNELRTFIVAGVSFYPSGNIIKCLDCEGCSVWIEEENLISK